MKREEFIREKKDISREELLKIAEDIRHKTEKPFPEELEKKFHSLDREVLCKEEYVNTAFGNTHIFIIRPGNVAPDEITPVVINVHGGGWTLHHHERDLYFGKRIAVKTGCMVIDIDYVLAPEYPYPAAIEEIEAFLDILPDKLEEWRGNPDKIIFCGQSAGGNLLGAVSQRKKYSRKINVIAQILCYLPADNYNNHYGNEDLSEKEICNEYYGFFYNKSLEERKNSDVSLVFATTDELAELPPTDILVGGQDKLMPEGVQYYNVLKDAGVKATCKCFERSHHSFLVNLMDEWEEGEAYVVSLIKSHLECV